MKNLMSDLNCSIRHPYLFPSLSFWFSLLSFLQPTHFPTSPGKNVSHIHLIQWPFKYPEFIRKLSVLAYKCWQYQVTGETRLFIKVAQISKHLLS